MNIRYPIYEGVYRILTSDREYAFSWCLRGKGLGELQEVFQ